jgi:hypothetical protein
MRNIQRPYSDFVRRRIGSIRDGNEGRQSPLTAGDLSIPAPSYNGAVVHTVTLRQLSRDHKEQLVRQAVEDIFG